MDFTDIPLDVCKERNSKRERPIPEKSYDRFMADMDSIRKIISDYKSHDKIEVHKGKFVQTDNNK